MLAKDPLSFINLSPLRVQSSLETPLNPSIALDPKHKPYPLNRLAHHLMRNLQLRKRMKVMRQARVIVQLAPHTLLPEHHVQHDAVVPETVLLRGHDVRGRELGEVVGEQREVRRVAEVWFPEAWSGTW
jgi:hypothetical protein